ncbi:flocculation protein FLO11-like [Puntigrus tetrazona]|uniref:flocculation protein FLO11-like n=1 Tax=Puntigrus tetrazona TaxID=1606681 RepID=UPI001C8ABDAB|nr:flocculation protein FLO11-like [Puntigrus tetrazona]
MAARSICVLLVSAVVINVTGMLATWIMSFQHSDIRMKSSINSFTVSSDAAQTETTTLASASDAAEGASSTPEAQIITNIPGSASVNVMPGSSAISRASSVAIAEPSLQTTAETAAVSAAGAGRSTAGETIVSSEKVEIHTLPGTKKDEIQETAETTATACTQIQESANEETLTNTAQKTPGSDRMSEGDIAQTHTIKTEISIAPTQKSGISTTPQFRSVTPIPVTVRATNFIPNKRKTSKITPEIKATTKTAFLHTKGNTFRTEEVMTGTKADLSEEKQAPNTAITKRARTAGTGPLKVETSERTTVRPIISSQAVKASNGPTMNSPTGLSLITMIEAAAGKQAKTVGKQTGKGVTITTIKPTVNDLNTISQETQTFEVFES